MISVDPLEWVILNLCGAEKAYGLWAMPGLPILGLLEDLGRLFRLSLVQHDPFAAEEQPTRSTVTSVHEAQSSADFITNTLNYN
jgi:hypothetical protein